MSETRSRAVDHLGFIRRTLGELTGYERLTFELIQNADDTSAKRLRFDVRDEALWVEDDGGFSNCGDQSLSPDDCLLLESQGHRCDFHSFRLVSGADKRLREDTTGAFGIGFTAVYQITDRPEIISDVLHWRVDETASEGGRIREERLEQRHEGTKIVLPWARDKGSEFRQRVEVSTVSENVEEELIESLEASVVAAMLFLRNLQTIEIARNGNIIRSVTRDVDGRTVLIDDGEDARLWHLIEADFEDEAIRLRVEHMGQLDLVRKARVEVAIPMGFEIDGRLCSTLPTEESTGLPVHVNGELYLTSDRRQLEMGTPHHSAWNTAVIETAGRLLAGSLPELPDLLGPQLLWQTLKSARNLFQDQGSDALGRALACFWIELEPKISHHTLVWASSGRWERVGNAKFVQSNEDEDAFGLLERLGITLVDSSLRAFQNILLAVGVKRLDFEHIALALQQAGLNQRIPLKRVPRPLDDAAARERLWVLLGRMLDRRRSGDLTSSRAELAGTALLPSTDGHLYPVEGLWRTDQRSVELLSATAPGFPFLDSEQLRGEAEPLARLCDELTPSDAVEQLSNRILEVDVALARDLIGWLSQREDRLKARDRELLKELEIFPSGDDVHPLRDIALAGDFEDPLQLAQLVDAPTAREHGGFLRRLSIEELSFSVYARVQIPRAFREGSLSLEQKRKVVSLLAREHLRLGEDTQAWAALAGVPLVECLDGSWSHAERVYFDSEPVKRILGERATRTRLPRKHTQATTAFLGWLGVPETPRTSDVIARVREISGQQPTGTNRRIVQDIVSWLGRGWKELRQSEKDDFTSLRELAWLPARNHGGWHEPQRLDLVFQQHLYESQGRFLDIPQRIQQEASEFLIWLEICRTPQVFQVAKHLSYCAENDIVPNLAVYDFLNNHYTDPAIGRLESVKCLHLGQKWCRPGEVYWSQHPFGRWRFELGQDLARYMRLFSKLGVKQSPDYTDAMGVIEDISAAHSKDHMALSEEDSKILYNCWGLCETALREGRLDPAELETFGRQTVVADSSGMLAPASHLFFEDLPGLGDKLPDIRRHIIRRPDGAWRAMRAAGVRSLSKVATARIADLGEELDEGRVRDRIIEREEELARVIAPRVDESWRNFSERMVNVRLAVVTKLVVVWELRAFERLFVGEPNLTTDALWNAPEERLYVVETGNGPIWEAVARELVRALLPDVEPATLALDVAAALRSEDREVAKRVLDAAGFAPLAPEIRAEISTAKVEVMDATEDQALEPYPDGSGESETGMSTAHDADGDRDGDPEGADKDDAPGNNEIISGEGQGDHDEGRVDISEGRTGKQRERGNAHGNTDEPSPPSHPRSRLRSYVERGDGQVAESTDGTRAGSIDEAGMEVVLDFERRAGRTPERQTHSNPGYDVLSYLNGEEERYIEVKSKAGMWDGMGIGLSDLQFAYAQKLEDRFWLYVVEYALDAEHRKLWPIQNPARKVTDFMFDDGWKDAAMMEEEGVDSRETRRRITPSPSLRSE